MSVFQVERGGAERAIAFVGDDIQDLPPIRKVGFAVSVPNGRPEVKAAAHWVTKTPGGRGAVREVVEFLLRAKGLWKGITISDRIDG